MICHTMCSSHIMCLPSILPSLFPPSLFPFLPSSPHPSLPFPSPNGHRVHQKTAHHKNCTHFRDGAGEVQKGQSHQLQGPLSQIQSPHVSWRRHAIEHSKADETSNEDITKHTLPVLQGHLQTLSPEPVDDGGKERVASNQNTQTKDIFL